MTAIAPRSAAAGRGRLTPVERLERELSETAFADQVLDLARVLGWRSLHIRPARTKHGWVTPVAGDGKGWPDLTLVRARDRRLVFAELKREVGGEIRPEQADWISALASLVLEPSTRHEAQRQALVLIPSVEVYVWRPSDLRDPIADSVIGRILR